MDQLIANLVAAFKQHSALPEMPEGLTLEQAYHLQNNLVGQLSDGQIHGFKAGITNTAAQQFFGLSQPVLGSLYSRGELSNGCSFTPAKGLLLECEIGIIVDQYGVPKSAGAAIEVVYMDWQRSSDLTASNIAAANLGADRFIIGPQHSWCEDYSEIKVSLSRDGEQLSQASLMDSLGGPERGLDWMLAEIERRQFHLQDAMLLMTGTCGAAVPALPGHYVADYGDLGKVEFTVSK